eukprot:m.765384 g.765384  ORF g.765384 m.765384 type:complete len:127 (+) comp59060_c0_seq4:506-886(+)
MVWSSLLVHSLLHSRFVLPPCKLMHRSISSPIFLKRMSFACNKIREIRLPGAPVFQKARFASVFGNYIGSVEQLQPFFACLPNIEELQLGGNPLAPTPEDLDPLRPSIAGLLPSLRWLDWKYVPED